MWTERQRPRSATTAPAFAAVFAPDHSPSGNGGQLEEGRGKDGSLGVGQVPCRSRDRPLARTGAQRERGQVTAREAADWSSASVAPIALSAYGRTAAAGLR